MISPSDAHHGPRARSKRARRRRRSASARFQAAALGAAWALPPEAPPDLPDPWAIPDQSWADPAEFADSAEAEADPWAVPDVQPEPDPWATIPAESEPDPWATTPVESPADPWAPVPADPEPDPWAVPEVPPATPEVAAEARPHPWAVPDGPPGGPPWPASEPELPQSTEPDPPAGAGPGSPDRIGRFSHEPVSLRPYGREPSSTPAAATPRPPQPPPPPPPLTQPPEWAADDRPGATTTLTEPGERPPAAGDVVPTGARHTTKKRSSTRNTVEWVVIIGFALLSALVIKTWLLQAFYIPSPSMVPTLHINDRVLVNKLSYRLHDVHRGDVVVFERPPNDTGQIRDLIKRVIALPGETVEAHDGKVWIDGRQLREPYLPAGTETSPFGPQVVQDGHIWVMGDNRGNSSDSRVFGAIDESSIIGRAFVRVWPLGNIALL